MSHEPERLVVPSSRLSDAFAWEAKVEIDPSSRKTTEGLFLSAGMYCTHCEADGFRTITCYATGQT